MRGGLWVRTSFDPKLQSYAQEALRDGLLRYARGQGWAGPLGHVDADDKTLSRFIGANVGIAYKDWRTAVVLSSDGGVARAGVSERAGRGRCRHLRRRCRVRAPARPRSLA